MIGKPQRSAGADNGREFAIGLPHLGQEPKAVDVQVRHVDVSHDSVDFVRADEFQGVPWMGKFVQRSEIAELMPRGHERDWLMLEQNDARSGGHVWVREWFR